MADKITATKLQQADFVQDPKQVQYTVLVEETRKDDVGTDYKYTSKVNMSKAQIEQQVAQIDAQIVSLQAQKTHLTAVDAKLV